MQKAKIKYYQPSVQELQTQKIDQIFLMLQKQQQGITSLLKKYQSYDDQQDLNQVFSHRNKHSKHKQSKDKQSSRKSKSLYKSRSKSNMMLPDINYLTKQNQRLAILFQRKKKKHSQTIQPTKTTLRKQLQMIYKDSTKLRQLKDKNQKNQKEKNSSKLKANQKNRLSSQSSTIIDNDQQRFGSNKKKVNETSPNINSNFASQQLNRQSSIPRPISIKNSLMLLNSNPSPGSDPSDSQQQDIPLAYYERQFKSKMTAQCIQQINYLYFSKNQSIKDWSQQLLSMFEKHDKQIVSLRKKMKYLQKFDDKFFAVDIYKND